DLKAPQVPTGGQREDADAAPAEVAVRRLPVWTDRGVEAENERPRRVGRKCKVTDAGVPDQIPDVDVVVPGLVLDGNHRAFAVEAGHRLIDVFTVAQADVPRGPLSGAQVGEKQLDL